MSVPSARSATILNFVCQHDVNQLDHCLSAPAGTVGCRAPASAGSTWQLNSSSAAAQNNSMAAYTRDTDILNTFLGTASAPFHKTPPGQSAAVTAQHFSNAVAHGYAQQDTSLPLTACRDTGPGVKTQKAKVPAGIVQC